MKYDVAFSLCKEDKAFAEAIINCLPQSIKRFYYVEKQEELIGKESVNEFREIFLNESKLVVIIYRNGWGTTPGTISEQDAIRDRYKKLGADYILLFPIDLHQGKPVWYPDSYVNSKLVGSDHQRLSRVILNKLELNDIVTKPVFSDIYRAINSEREIADKKRNYLFSTPAANDAEKLVWNLFHHFDKRFEEIAGVAKEKTPGHYNIEQVIRVNTISLRYSYRPEASNSAENCQVEFQLANAKLRSVSELVDRKTYVYDFDPITEVKGWRLKDKRNDQMVSLNDIADEWFFKQAEAVKNEIDGKNKNLYTLR